MKICALMENTTKAEGIQAEHGLSLYIETLGHKILMDMGQTGAFADNAEVMGVDLSQVDLAILSHGHYDHGGGLQRFLELNDHAPVYVSRHAFGDHRNGEKYIGLDPELRKSDRLIFTEDRLTLDEGLTLYSCNTWPVLVPIKPFGLTADGKPDPFLHEQYLLVEEEGKTILLSGCSHKGVVNLTHWFHPDVLVGGFHYKKLSTEGEDAAILDQAADALMEYRTRYYTCHCTGVAQYDYLRQRMGDRLEYLSAGQTISI